ncbi:MAG: TIGR04100 family radical SAM protein [Ruminococcaceae bacterium]|nr:TIGR04100 family radical SAM protein [Oscillospiraceae bacterium]
MTILYELDGGLYVNVTNKCPCSCIFCIRQNGDCIRESDSLWFGEEEPSVAQIIAEFDKWDLSKYNEIVFCGYGEPLERLDDVKEICRHLRGITKLPIRLNTNGLSDLIAGREHTALELEGLFDTVSISLNAPDAKSFVEVTNSCYGEQSFDSMLAFAKECKTVVPRVVFTVVDVITPEQIAQCQVIADSLGIPLRVRTYIKQY